MSVPESSPYPPANPVNARVLQATVVLVARRQIWLETEDDLVRAWAPDGTEQRIPPGERLELYLGDGGIPNGWWDRTTGLAINQRRLGPRRPPLSGADPMACQGQCGLVWLAPAAEGLIANDERCLTCAGPLELRPS